MAKSGWGNNWGNAFGGGAPKRPKDPFALPKEAKPEPRKNPGEARGNQALAIEALASGKRLALTYEGLPRIVEVHTVGDTRADRAAMNVWQVDGQAESGSVPGWFMFCFDQCFDVRLTDWPSAAPRPGYRPGAKQFSRIDAQL